MFARILQPSDQSILLLGPRGTGKSTWIRQHFKEVPTYDLLDNREAMRLVRNPEVLYRELSLLPPQSRVVIDEIQKVPALLDEVHRLIEDHKLIFVLSGSSARKLKRDGVNLLAGRARITHMFPLVFSEFYEHESSIIDWDKRIILGNMPVSISGSDPIEYLVSYTSTYIREEIQHEALVRNIGGFARFLEVAARQNGQLTNMTAIARDTGVSRLTVQSYFEILCDTLMGYWLHPWKQKSSSRQVTHPKFYFFDSGIARALSERIAYPPTQEEMGPLMETCLLAEIRAYISYNKLHYPIHFWRTYDGTEVDVFIETADDYVGIEIKASDHWERRFHRGLARLAEEVGRDKVRSYGIFRGKRSQKFDPLLVLTIPDFLERLWQGEIIR